MSSKRLIVIGPVPPPYHGVTISTSLILAAPSLRERFAIDHIDTSDRREFGNLGRWDSTNILLGIRALTALWSRLRGSRGIVYLPLSQNTPAFLRDSLYIHAAALRGWKVALHLRGSDFRTFYLESHRLMRWWMRLTLRRVESVAVMGESLRWVFEGLVPSEKICVVPNGTPEPRRGVVARDPEHVLFLSNLLERKGVAQALEAALLVLNRRPTARFTFAGTWQSADLERKLRLRSAEANGRIDFRPAVRGTERDTLMASAAIFLFPPVKPEGHPRVVLEAIAHGLPVVTTDRGAIRETVVDGKMGFVLPECDPRELADRLLVLLEDESLRERFARAAREHYLTYFTQARADERFANWLVDLAEQSPDRVPTS